MKTWTRIAFCLFALVVALGCASTKVTGSDSNIGTQRLVRPDRIYVYPFAATVADIPTWSAAGERYARPSTPQSPEAVEAGRGLGELVATELVRKIEGMGLSAVGGNRQSRPRTDDILIVGYFEAVEEGSTAKRVVLGFGSGAAELTTTVEGYQMTDQGPRRLGSTELESGGNKMPGLFVPIAVVAATANPIGLIVMGTTKVAGEVTGRSKASGAAKRTADAIAEQLRARFQQQGWIR